jgi:two-component system chemotaxis response regulator CheB
MQKIRILIVDDSVVVRRLVTDALTEDPELEVIGSAPNGRIALQKIPQLVPDIITLDVEMPELGGIETLKAIRKGYPTIPVIMFSTLTERGAAQTVEALSWGASDYVTKPANVGSVSEAKTRVKNELSQKIKALHARAGGAKVPPVAVKTTSKKRVKAVLSPEIVAVGVSTGGPQALGRLLGGLPAWFPWPVVIVQHMPPVFTKNLADRLNMSSELDVVEGEEGMRIEPGGVYIAPGDFHLEVQRKPGGAGRLHLTKAPPENSCRPAVDVLFRSVAASYGGRALAIVLTGMGQDGLRGCECILDSGGAVWAQDEATSVVWGMPGAVCRNGCADEVLPLPSIARELTTLAKRWGAKSPPGMEDGR